MKSLCLLLMVCMPSDSLTNQQLIQRGEEQYRSGIAHRDDLREAIPYLEGAIDSYLQLWERGNRSSKLAWNLARLYSLLEQFPESMQWYRRAGVLDPINRSLQLEHQQLRDRLKIPADLQSATPTSWLSDANSLSVILIGIGVLNLLGSIAFAISYLKPQHDYRLFSIVSWLMVVTLSVVVFARLDRAQAASRKPIVIVRDEGCTLRTGNGTLYPVSFAGKIPLGCELIFLESRGSWSFVELADGTRGWVPLSQLLDASVSR